MIQANELRVGNWIILPNGSHSQVNYHTIRYAQIYPDNGYMPIPITPEVLKKCGWELQPCSEALVKEVYGQDVYSLKSNEDFVLAKVKDGYVFCDHIIGDVKPITSLHQLQNLYFALTGEELKYQP